MVSFTENSINVCSPILLLATCASAVPRDGALEAVYLPPQKLHRWLVACFLCSEVLLSFQLHGHTQTAGMFAMAYQFVCALHIEFTFF